MVKKKSKLQKPALKPERPSTLPFPIIEVGASAGGLEAATHLLRRLPSNARIALVLVSHLDPKQPSALASILARVTPMSVLEAENGMSVERGHIYIIPPNKILSIAKGIFKLQPRSAAADPHSPIDYFLRSRAKDQSSRAIVILLSGTARDGADGFEAIKANDGITFAQTEQSSKHGGTPASAKGAADFVLPPEEIAAELVAGFADLFESVDTKQRIYAKPAVSEPRATRLPTFIIGAGTRDIPAPQTPRRRSDNILGEIRKQADALALSDFAPDGVVVSSRMDTLQFRGRMESYLGHEPGTANLNLLRMARQGLSVELRPLIARSNQQKRAMTFEGIHVRDGGKRLIVNARHFAIPDNGTMLGMHDTSNSHATESELR